MIGKCLDRWLTDDEYFLVDNSIGHIFDPDTRRALDDMQREIDESKRMPPPGPQDDIPF